MTTKSKASTSVSAPADEATANTGPTVQATIGNTPANNDHVIVAVVANPKRPGTASHTRFAAYKVGMTIAEAIKAGVTRADVRWDMARDFITLEEPKK